MKISKEARKASKELFQYSFVEGRLDASRVKAVAAKVAERKPRHYMEILKNYQRLVRLEVEKHHAVIESAKPLDETVSEHLLSSLSSKHGGELSSEFKVTGELIGGTRIKLGSTVWDSSLKGHLDRLKDQFAQV